MTTESVVEPHSSLVAREPGRQRIILFSIAFASFMVNVDTYIVNISLPTISRYFNVSAPEVSWVVLAYQLTITSFLLVMGRLGDQRGLKKVFLLGFGIFTASSLLCGLAPNLGLLVLGRAIQGIGASMLFALTPAMIPRFLPAEKRGSAFGTNATLTALGMTTGTAVGGLITGFLSWHWIFLVNIPIGIAAILVARRYIPDDSSEAKSLGAGRFDLPGAFLSLIWIFSFIYALSKGSDRGWQSPLIVICFLAALVGLVLFIYRELHAENPLLDLSLFKNREFSFGNLSTFMAYALLAGTNFLMPFYLVLVAGLQPQQAGAVYLFYTLIYAITGPIAGRLSNRIHPRILCVCGMAIGSLTAFGFAFNLDSNSILPAVITLAGMAITFGTFSTSNNNVIMSMAPPGKIGMVASTFRMVMRLSLSIGVVMFASLFTWGFSGQAASSSADYALLPVGILTTGFKHAYIAGGITCLVALSFSFMARKQIESTV